MTTKNKNWKTILDNLEKKLSKIFLEKFPEMPKKIKDIIVKYGPYLVVAMLILSIPTILALVGIIITATPSAFFGGDKGFKYILTILFGLIMLILQIMAIPGLFKRQFRSWKILFYISIISAFSNLVKGDIFDLVVGSILSWYILFQIRSYYKSSN